MDDICKNCTAWESEDKFGHWGLCSRIGYYEQHYVDSSSFAIRTRSDFGCNCFLDRSEQEVDHE